MSKHYLAIIERAFRGTLEEQYSHILWLSHSLKKMKANLDILLCGNAVLYALADQIQQKLQIGGIRIEHLPNYETTIKEILRDGIKVFVTKKDRQRLCISCHKLIEGIQEIEMDQLTHIIIQYDQIWFW